VHRLALVLAMSVAASVAAAAPAQATIRYCQGWVDADCFFTSHYCYVYFAGVPLTAPDGSPQLCL
jgi:hypothetical protein